MDGLVGSKEGEGMSVRNRFAGYDADGERLTAGDVLDDEELADLAQSERDRGPRRYVGGNGRSQEEVEWAGQDESCGGE